MAPRAFITGISEPGLTDAEGAFLRETRPWGVILFKRNIINRKQLIELTHSIRSVLGRETPILVDQEGGRVQRLGPPEWPVYPSGARYGALFVRRREAGLEAAELGARLIASDLRDVGIDVDCLPIADVPISEGDPIIGDRAYGETPEQVAAIASAVARGLMRGGVLPVLKHIPGHGRATADSHVGLPVVDTTRAALEKTDFAAFRPLAMLPLGMTAHVVFSAIDPLQPATTSATIVREVIRGWIGFAGLLMSDDVSMSALSGTIDERARAALAAGCDIVLHCNGDLEEMRAVAAVAPELAGEPLRRAQAASAARRSPDAFDITAARARFSALMVDVDAQEPPTV